MGANWYPTLRGLVPPAVDDAIRIAFDNLYTLRGQVQAANNAVQQVAGDANNTVIKIINTIQANGTAPLNVTGLPGVLADVQRSVNFGLHALRVLGFPPASYPAQLFAETDRDTLYYSSGIGWFLISGQGYGTFEDRWADLGPNDAGALYFETGRNNISAVPPLLTYRWDGNSWAYTEGQISRNQADLATLAGTLGAGDTGLPVNVTDYHHQLAWDGNNNNWNWGPNDDLRAGEGPIFREVDPSGNGWHLYDGNGAVPYLLANGNTATAALPDLVSGAGNSAFLVGGSPNGGPNAAVAPTFTGNNFTPLGNVTAAFNGNSLTPAGTISANFNGTPGTTGNASAVIGFQNGNGASLAAAANTHNHAFTPAGTVSANFNGTPVVPTGNISANFNGTPGNVTGTVSNNGTPRNLVRRPWFRQ